MLRGDREMKKDKRGNNNYSFHAKDVYATNLKKDQKKSMSIFLMA